MKRNDYISWEEYFISVAKLSSLRSKDPVTQVGACIVNDDNVIVGIGYNGFPRGCDDDKFSWNKNKLDMMDNKNTFVVHAELNAIINSNHYSLKGCKLYVTLFPCNECAKVIIQSGITDVYYLSRKNNITYEASELMFKAANVKFHKLDSENILRNLCNLMKE